MTVACYYELLGVPRSASTQDIKRAFRQAARRWHPDKNPGNRELAEKHFKELTTAYEVLGDARRRAEYELHGAAKPTAPQEDWADAEAAEELFESFFGMFAETSSACTAAEALLGQMGSLSFADAMISFCREKVARAEQRAAPDAPVGATEVAEPEEEPATRPGAELEAEARAPSGGNLATGLVLPQPAAHSVSEEVFATPPASPEPECAEEVFATPPASPEPECAEPEAFPTPPPSPEPKALESPVSQLRQRWCDIEEEDDDAFGAKCQRTSGFSSDENSRANLSVDTTLRHQLQELQAESEENVLLVRGINRLGFDSKKALMEMFTPTGTLKNVLVTHSKVKAGKRRERIRPAALGFVIMTSAEAVQRELRAGEHREIEGVAVKVQPFKHSKDCFDAVAQDC